VIERRTTICNRDCPDACGIVATVEDGRVTRLQGDPRHPVTRGFLCHRTSHFLPRQYSPERLTTPLWRRDGELEPISWEAALDLAAERLCAIRKESGGAAIFHYRSGGSLGILKHLSDYFFERFGPVTVKRGDICSGAGDAAQEIDFAVEDSHDLFDLLNARNILLWGKNVFISSPHTLPVLKAAAARGAKLLLIDPVFHRTADLCEACVQPRPGGDFALAMATLRVLFERGWADPAAPSYCDHLEELRALALGRSLAAWCAEADVPPEAAEDLARRLGPGRPAAILVGWGMQRRVNGAAIVRALDALGAVSGNLGVAGGGVSFYFQRRRAFDLRFIRGIAGAPRTVCEPLFGPELLGMRDPPIRAVWVTAANPVAMLPQSETVRAALESRDLVVVVDSFLTDTACAAHLVLPTTTLLEDDDLLGAYGHHFVGASRPVVPPPPGVKTDLEILQALAERVGLGDVLAGDARAWKERLLSPELAARGIALDRLEAGPIRSPLSPEVLFSDRLFATPTGRVNLLREPPPAPAPPAPGFPLFLLALATEKSQSSQWVRPPESPPVAVLHPDAAGGLANGELGRLESVVSSMVVRVRHDARQRRDVVIVPKGGHLSCGHCANALVQARTTDLGEGAAYYDERVRILPF
jgi:anaerobic selenocysteine-containing dehydrogenase